MKILAVGNSFSQDATAYLQPMARAGGFPVQAANLFIPGCSLEMHWKNAESGEAAYSFQVDGEDTGRMASLRESLTETAWDVVTLQQTNAHSRTPGFGGSPGWRPRSGLTAGQGGGLQRHMPPSIGGTFLLGYSGTRRTARARCPFRTSRFHASIPLPVGLAPGHTRTAEPGKAGRNPAAR